MIQARSAREIQALKRRNKIAWNKLHTKNYQVGAVDLVQGKKC